MAYRSDTELPDLIMILLGKSGVGKSASGNTILERQAFTSKISSTSTTQKIQMENKKIDELSVYVYDTPGFSNTELSDEDVIQKCSSIFPLQNCDCTVILLVIPIGRFSPEDQRAVEEAQKILEQKHLENTWILFTHGDALERERRSVEDFIRNSNHLRQVVQRFENRYHVFNNTIQNPAQVKELLRKTTTKAEKRYTLSDRDINLVERPSDLDPFDDDDILRAVLSCGHVTGPQTLTDYCKVQIEEGKFELRCPVCGEEWPYEEVRCLAKLTQREQEFFEKTLAKNAIIKHFDFKSCPGCHSFIMRSDQLNMCVECTICSERTGRTYEFCWKCEKEWKGPRPRSDRCDNEGCVEKELDILLNCETITLPQVQNIECPSVRACPTCGLLIEHNTEACKNIVCSRCSREFCFLCLKLTPECLRTSTHFVLCSDGVAPRQTSIPSWFSSQSSSR